MRNPDPLEFWTNLGARLLGRDAPELPAGPPWNAAWASPPSLMPSAAPVLEGEGVRPRKIAQATREALAPLGFARALRLHPWPGVELFLPFYRNFTAVLPQGFSDRIPAEERALAVAGKSAAAGMCGYVLVVSAARVEATAFGIFRAAGVACATPDLLRECCRRVLPGPGLPVHLSTALQGADASPEGG